MSGFLAGGASNTWWIAPRKYDFTEIDNRIAKIIREYPNAYVVAWIWLCPPPWYAKAYPIAFRETMTAPGSTTYRDRHLLRSDYREDAKHAIDAFVKHCESLYSSRMIAYNLCGGVSLEWQGWMPWAPCQESTGRLQSLRQARFPGLCRQAISELKVSDLPSYEQRFSSTDTIFRDPVKDLVARIHDEFYSQSIADTICLLPISQGRNGGEPCLSDATMATVSSMGT